jgi:hypothetical protein
MLVRLAFGIFGTAQARSRNGEVPAPNAAFPLQPAPLDAATRWLEQHRRPWEGRFERFDAVLAELKVHAQRAPTRRARRRKP